MLTCRLFGMDPRLFAVSDLGDGWSKMCGSISDYSVSRHNLPSISMATVKLLAIHDQAAAISSNTRTLLLHIIVSSLLLLGSTGIQYSSLICGVMSKGLC